jgi:predicted nucleic acid-binding Zn ribbon protein
LDIARKAFNAFRTLANALEATTVREIAVVEGRTVNGTEAWELLTAIKSDRRDLIGIYSQRYGSLWGYAEYHKLGAWMSEAGEFLDLHDVAQMITPRGSPQDFENRVKRNSIGISYRGVRPHSLPMFIPGWNRTHFNPRDLLLNEISKKLEGGFSLDGRYDSGNSANITPTHLIHLLYLRMWLDVIDAKPLERECVVCGEAIEGKNRNRKYCGYACRQRHYRRRHAQRQ